MPATFPCSQKETRPRQKNATVLKDTQCGGVSQEVEKMKAGQDAIKQKDLKYPVILADSYGYQISNG
jgi:hypothetical protein